VNISVSVAAGTVSEAVHPVVAEVHAQKADPPGPGRVPGQLQQAVPVPHEHVSSQLTASHEQPEGVSTQRTCSVQFICASRHTFLVSVASI